MAFDPNTRRIYTTKADIGGGVRGIVELFGSDSDTPNTETGNSWALPSAIASNLEIGGMEIEPVSGDFLVIRNQIYSSGGNNYIDVYRLPRSGGYSVAMAPYFSINLTDLGSTATGTNGMFGMTYDPVMHRLFLADRVSKRIYEVAPVKLISSRS